MKARDVRCPACGSAAGDACQGRDGALPLPHHARTQYARAQTRQLLDDDHAGGLFPMPESAL